LLARRRPSYLVLALIALVSAVVALSRPAHAISAPQRAEVHYTSTYAEPAEPLTVTATAEAVTALTPGIHDAATA
jgi:hypothetical protein